MERKYFSKKELPQRSHEWFLQRMGKFTSSPSWQLFTEPTQEKRAIQAIGYLKNNSSIDFTTHTPSKDAHFTLCFNYLEINDTKERKALKAEIKGKEKLSNLSIKVLEFYNVYNELHCFSEGAEEYIYLKAWDYLFPNPEASVQTASMERGNELEPQAIAAYLRNFKNLKASTASFVTLGDDIASSPDLIVKDEKQLQIGGAEVKCRERKGFSLSFKRLKTASDLLKYASHKKAFWQIHHQIFTCGLDWVDYVHYNDQLDMVYDPIENKMIASAYQHKCIHTVRIHRDESIIKQFEKVLLLAIELRNKYLKEILK